MHRLSIVNKDGHKVLIYNVANGTLTTDFSIYLKWTRIIMNHTQRKQSYSVPKGLCAQARPRIAAPVCGTRGTPGQEATVLLSVAL